MKKRLFNFLALAAAALLSLPVMADEVKDDNGVITSPADGTHKFYTRSGSAFDGWGSEATQSGQVEMVECEGGVVYIKDIISQYTKGTWVKGTLADNTITVATGQVVYGMTDFGDTYLYELAWGTSTYDEEEEEYVMTIDQSKTEITFTVSGNVISLNGSSENSFIGIFNHGVGYTTYNFCGADYATVYTLEEDIPDSNLPYTNALSTADEFGAFTVIDVNGDGTWSFNSNNSAAGYSINYADGDDWLVSPAIHLEAGKKYHFAIDVRNSSKFYEGRMEVKMADEATAAKLSAGTEVIAADNYTNTEFVTKDNENVTVAETGNYFFGIHAITEEDTYSTLYVANFLVEEVNTEAPAAVTDLAAEQTGTNAEATITFTAPTLNQGGEALAGNLTKIELLRDDEVIKTFEDVVPGAELQYVDAATVGKHVYAVIAYNAAGEGKKSAEVSITLTGVLSVPYTANFSSKDTYQMFSVIDGNQDDTTWEWASYPGAAKFDNSWGNGAGDDFLVSPAISLKAGKTYKVTVSAETDWSTEKFEVLLGTEATTTGLTQPVIDEQTIENTSAKNFSGTVTIAEDGNYYVAIHATSGTGGYGALIVYSLSIEEDEAAATTGDAIDDLPYENALNAEGFSQFGVLDVNGDGYTWKFSDYYYAPYYNYNYDNDGEAADDWLVSPAILLEEGKTYQFSLDVRKGGSDTQKVEVKIATEAKASQLAAGATVISSTDVTSSSFVTFENNELTVSETGYYHFGIHAFTSYSASLYVQDFKVKEAGEDIDEPGETEVATVPYTADLTDKNTFDTFTVVDGDSWGDYAWTWASATSGARLESEDWGANDDYLITVPISLQTGKTYKVTVTAKAYWEDQTFEVLVGNDATKAALTQTVIESTTIETGDFDDYDGTFTVAEDGDYYVAVHSTTESDYTSYLYVKTIAIEEITTTGIHAVNGSEFDVNGYYNLNGQRVERATKGLYIINGKKVAIK